MDPAAIGKKIKLSSPGSYDDLSDQEVGTKYLAKYGSSISSVANGQATLQDIPIDQRSAVGVGLDAIGVTPQAVSQSKKQSVTLRKDFYNETKNSGFDQIRSAWDNVQGAGPGGAGDISIIYSYIKALDPNSVVREGEIDLTKAAESIPSNIIRAYQRAKEGRAISPQLRQQMVSEIGNLYNQKLKQQQERNAFYTGLATDSGVDPKDVIGNYGDLKPAEVPNIEGGQQTQAKGLVGLLSGAVQGVGNFLLPNTTEAIQKPQGEAVTNRNLPFIERLKNIGTNAASVSPNQQGDAITSEVASTLLGPKAFSNLFQKGAVAVAPKLASGAGDASGGIGSKIIKTVDKVREYTPRSYFGRKQAEAAAKSTAKIDTKAIEKAGTELVDSVPGAKPYLDKNLSSIKKAGNPTELLKRLEYWGNAYTKSQQVGKTEKAALFDTLYKAGLEQLKQKAPEVYNNRQAIRLSYEIPVNAGKALWYGTLGKLFGK